MEHAKGAGAWETYTAGYEAGSFPIQGWWIADINGPKITLTFRMRQWDGAFQDAFEMSYTRSDGWKSKVLN